MAHSGKTITFATDLLPQENNIYSLGNNDQRWKIYGEMQPIAIKTYTAALYNSSSGANYYQTFATVTPSDYNAIWIAHYRITITASGHSDYTEICDVNISGRSNTYYSYKIYNSLVTYPIYYHILLNSSSASYPHELGYKMASSYGATDVQKTVKVELLEQINCTITLLDSLKLYTSAVPTNYSAWRTFNATSNGLQEAGDANDTAAYMYSNGFKGQVGSNKIYPYTLFARTGNGKYESFVLSSTTAASKSVNTHGFLPDGKIYYNNGSGTYNEGTLNFSPYQQYHVIDYRYSFNINNSTLPDYCETYLVWTYDITDGLLYLDTTQWLTTALPSNADGKIYQRIGSRYYTGTTNWYQGSLLLDNPYYTYDGTKLQIWQPHADSAGNITGTLALANLTKGDANTALMGKGSSTAPAYVSVSPSISITAGTTDNAPKLNLTVLGISGTTAQELTKATTGVYGTTKLYDGVDSTSTTLAATANAVKTAYDKANGLLAAADAMVFKGTLGTGGTITAVPDGTSGKTYQAGYTYKVITAGKYANIQCEVGDLLIAIADSASGQTAVNNAHWTVAQTNIDGAVTGPAAVSSGRDNSIARFNGETGKIIQDSLVTIDDKGHMSFGAEKVINFRMNRKKADGGVWDCPYINWYDNANTQFARIGVYGQQNDLSYMYLGAESFISTKNLKILPSGRVRVLSLDFNGTGSYGSETQPIYWKDGVPVACTSYANASVNYAESAGVAATVGTNDVGTISKPIYLVGGTPTECNIEIGGRNLLKNSHSTAQDYTYPTSGISDKSSWVTATTLYGGTYTLSFWAKSTVANDKIRVHFYNPSNITSVKGSQGQSSTATDGYCDFTLSTTWTKYWVIYTIPIGTSTRSVIIPRLANGQGSGTVSFMWEKLEAGNQPTDWSPAWEDFALAASYLPLAGGTMTGLITAKVGATHTGIKIGNTYVTSANAADLVFQNNGAIRFGADNWDYDKWAGLKYDSTNKIIYLGIPDKNYLTANTAQSNGTLHLVNTRYLKMYGRDVLNVNTAIDNTAFTSVLSLFHNESNESTVASFDATKSSWGITFERQWSTGNVCAKSAGIFAYGINSWRTGLVFRTKTGTSYSGSHDTTALYLNHDGGAVFANTVQMTTLNTNVLMNANGGGKIRLCDSNLVTTSTPLIGEEGNLTSSTEDSKWLKALLKALADKYPSESGYIYRGKISPNSVGYYEVDIYGTGTVDSTTGLPQYSYGTFRKYTDAFYVFGTSNYSYFCTSIVRNSGTWGISITGNAATATKANLTTTANAIAYYTNTTGTFGTKASANGALYATEANGALNWGTLPVAQGGTGKTTAADAWTALGGGASGKHADSYFVKAVTSTDNAIVRFDSTSGQVQNSKATLDDDGYITLTHIAGKSGESKIIYSSTISMWWGVGTGNENHGFYDDKAGKWILSAGAANTWTFVGNVTGNADTATKATADASGNTITTYYCTLSTAQTLSGAKTFSAALVAQANVTVGTTTAGALGLAQTNGTGLGISLYGGPKAGGSLEYGIMFAKTATFGKCGSVTSDWATYFTMNRNDARGWIFKSNAGASNGNNNVMSIAGNGNIYTEGNIKIQNVTLQWNATDQSLDFIFA